MRGLTHVSRLHAEGTASVQSRRDFLTKTSGAALVSALHVRVNAVESLSRSRFASQEISLDGDWWFRLDRDSSGEQGRWFAPQTPSGDWLRVTVPHAWQVAPGMEDYRGLAW